MRPSQGIDAHRRFDHAWLRALIEGCCGCITSDWLRFCSAANRRRPRQSMLIGLVAGWLIFLFCGPLQADIRLPKFFSDHMVIQQQSNFPVWGTAEPNQVLVVRFNGIETKTVADAEGKFSTKISTPKKSGPYEIEIADEKDANKIVINDVMVGEVWLCVGQSNLGMPVKDALNPETEIAQASTYKMLRLMSIEPNPSVQPVDDVAKLKPWAICSSDSVKDFSAVSYFFGRELHKTLEDTPVGLIQASVEGSRCEAWSSLKSIQSNPALDQLRQHWEEIEELSSPDRPGNLFNGMIAPLTRYPLAGVIWYQGAANVGRGSQYADLLPNLIADWRLQFNSPALPFYLVQLPPCRYKAHPPDALPEVWDAQLKTLKSVPGIGVITTMDVGNVEEFRPKNKQAIGLRLAVMALVNTYQTLPAGMPPGTPVSGPVYESLAIEQGKIRVTFKNAGKGLRSAIVDQPIGSFLICGPDKVFHPAEATIVGSASIEVSSTKVPNPTAVRYCWDDSAASSLINSVGLPAFPFRTDDFELSSEGSAF